MVLAIGRAISLAVVGFGCAGQFDISQCLCAAFHPENLLYGYQCVGLHTRFTHPGKAFSE